MRTRSRILINTPDIEIWPADLLRARGSRDARALSRAHGVLRRKRDGRYLAAAMPEGVLPLVPRWMHEPGVDFALDALDTPSERRRPGVDAVPALPLHDLEMHLDALEIDGDAYAGRTGLHVVAEPTWLAFAGFDRFRRPLWLHADAARAWAHMAATAQREDVLLDAISGYRSHAHQLGIFERKLQRGLSLDQILSVNAAPGYSEHHSGLALDIGAPGEPPAEASFEQTPAFAWLVEHADAFGFAMSYPRGNPHGIVYEPWHWAFVPAA